MEDSKALTSVFETVIDAIVIIDSKGTMVRVNQAGAKLFGYDQDEMLGRNVSMVMPEPDHSRHDGYLRNYIQTGDAKIIGIGREVTALLRRNGPALRTLGWIVENDDGRNHRNTVTWTLKPPPEPTEADGEGRSDSRYSRDSSVLVDGEFGREPGASQPKTGNSRKNITLNSEDEFASDASQDRASNLPCRYCGKAIPAHMKSQRARGYCGAAGCGAAANRVAR